MEGGKGWKQTVHNTAFHALRVVRWDYIVSFFCTI